MSRQHFLSLGSDKQRWEYLIQLDKSLFKILLDNDETYVQFQESVQCMYGWNEYEWDSFDGWIGGNECAVAICEALGMDVEGV